MKIVLDCYGSDSGAKYAVEGAVNVVNKCEDVFMILTGDKSELDLLLSDKIYDPARIQIVDAPEVITNEDSPTEAVRRKTNSSLVKAFELLHTDDHVQGLVSCGSTGAVLTGAFLKVGRIKGVSRPALCPILPAKNGEKVMLIDSGANVDCKPINLCHFALMATEYCKAFLGKENPRVALLNIGTEDKKGNEFAHECFELLSQLPINFVGNMEARDFLSGKYDVVVADGFYGNILLKSVEGTAGFILDLLKTEIKSSVMSKIGALFMKNTFKNLKSTLNYNNYGGAAFLGVKKLVVKGHGASDAKAFENAILQVKTLADYNLNDKIEQSISHMEVKESE